MDNFGGIDSFIEFRATRSDVKSDFLVDDSKCIWSGRTGPGCFCPLCNWRSNYVQDTSPYWHGCSQVQPGRSSSNCILSIFALAGTYNQYQEMFACFVLKPYSNMVKLADKLFLCRNLYNTVDMDSEGLGSTRKWSQWHVAPASRKSKQHCLRIQRWKFKLFAS